MASIGTDRSTVKLPLSANAAQWWLAWARTVRQRLQNDGIAVRDACLLLPQPAHLASARRAWAATGDGWMPRMGTVMSLAQELGGARAALGGLIGPTGDALVDGLAAREMLLQQSWGPAWLARDPRGFELGVLRLVEAALAFSNRAATFPPQRRAAWLSACAVTLTASVGVMVRERMLALLGLDWATRVAGYASDVLFALRPGAWVLLESPADMTWVRALADSAQAQGVPVVWVRPEPQTLSRSVRATECHSFEDEAQAAAAQVLAWVQGSPPGGEPVALITQDRELSRRIRALLERARLQVADETGWKLSTTRAGAAVMAWLRAAQPRASAEDLLDAVCCAWGDLALVTPQAARELESALRLHRWVRVWGRAWPDEEQSGDAHDLWRRVQDHTEPLRWSGRLPLSQALTRLATSLRNLRVWAALESDEAGAQVLAALRLAEAPVADGPAVRWKELCDSARLDAGEFVGWVDAALESAVYLPTPPASPQVIFTPAMRAGLRPWRAVVWPGADDEHLSEAQAPLAWLGRKLLTELGLSTMEDMRHRAWSSVCTVLAGAPTALLWRHSDADRPMSASRLLQRWAVHTEAGELAGLEAADEARVERRLACNPVRPPAPSLMLHMSGPGSLLPARVSSTSYEALRACPYRFYAQVLLGLREVDELDDTVSKRDFGTWLHEVLRRFHAQADADSADQADDLQRLHACARAVRDSAGWQDTEGQGADFLPFAAAFERIAPEYLAWWHQRQQDGAAIHQLEAPYQVDVRLSADLSIKLHGQIDRIDTEGIEDTEGRGAARVWHVIDYKTSSKTALSARMKPLSEDTQMAFYAALLMLSGVEEPLAASYLALEDRSVTEVPHAEVQTTARCLLDGLADDFTRIASGAVLPALGEGPACDYCAARGMCRRDHWAGSPARPA